VSKAQQAMLWLVQQARAAPEQLHCAQHTIMCTHALPPCLCCNLQTLSAGLHVALAAVASCLTCRWLRRTRICSTMAVRVVNTVPACSFRLLLTYVRKLYCAVLLPLLAFSITW
jgi:hypothetical protein